MSPGEWSLGLQIVFGCVMLAIGYFLGARDFGCVIAGFGGIMLGMTMMASLSTWGF